MNDSRKAPLLLKFYERYLDDHDGSAFLQRVEQRYRVPTIERLVEWGDRLTRRGAVLALGQLGDYSSNCVLGRALLDEDRGVRTLADSGVRKLWCRVGGPAVRMRLEEAICLNAAKRYDEAFFQATDLIHEAPWFAEAWNQRALAQFHRNNYEQAIRDGLQALEINPYHFPAATAMGKSYLQLGDRRAALECFRRALRINPSLDDVRAHVVYLQRSLKND